MEIQDEVKEFGTGEKKLRLKGTDKRTKAGKQMANINIAYRRFRAQS